ncbi:hypothetical protein B0H14DRAFT_3519771 [Mycena olivaceomarginata]|nr:hypothetical protein B0H14DRAFT_3519771 [Mycena olivaceomarginata]
MELGERQALSTPIATKERFDAALASLKELSQVQYIAPQAPPILAVPDEADIVIVDDQSTQIPDVVNVASNNNPDPAQTNTPPSPPFPGPARRCMRQLSTQIMASVWDNHRVQSVARKWHTARIWVAYSRKLISVNDPGYDGILTGFQDLGTFTDVFGKFHQDGFGGHQDQVVQAVLLDVSELNPLRTLYNVPSTAKVFSMYFFYMDQDSHSAAVIAASSESAARAPAPTFPSAAPPLPAAPTPPTSVVQYLETRFPAQTALLRAIDSSNIGPAYKKHAVVRLIRESRSIGTFSNHNSDHNTCIQAKSRLLQKLDESNALQLTNTETRAGTLLYFLLEADLLDPSPTNFVVPPHSEYALSKAVTCSAASVMRKANNIVPSSRRLIPNLPNTVQWLISSNRRAASSPSSGSRHRRVRERVELRPMRLGSGIKNSEARHRKDKDGEDTRAPSGCGVLAQLHLTPWESDARGQGGGRDWMEEEVCGATRCSAFRALAAAMPARSEGVTPRLPLPPPSGFVRAVAPPIANSATPKRSSCRTQLPGLSAAVSGWFSESPARARLFPPRSAVAPDASPQRSR